MGYSQSGLQNNFTMITPQFINCSGGQMDVQDLIATGPNIEDNVRIQFLSSTGYATNIVMWADGEGLDEPAKGYCWADTGWGAKTEGLKINPGQGLWILGKNTSQTVQSSGAVPTSDVKVQLCNNFTACGNPFPVEIDLQDILVSGPNIEDNVRIQFLSSTGYATNIVMWADGEELDNPTKGYCWADTGWEAKIEGVKIAPGQGLWVLGKNTDQYLTFPAPEL